MTQGIDDVPFDHIWEYVRADDQDSWGIDRTMLIDAWRSPRKLTIHHMLTIGSSAGSGV